MPTKQIQTDDTTQFWMVGLKAHGAPKRRHQTLALAAAEAQRLCAKYKQTAYIVEVIGQYIFVAPDGKESEVALHHEAFNPKKGAASP